MNIGNLYRQGEFELMTQKEISEQAVREYQLAKKQGKING